MIAPALTRLGVDPAAYAKRAAPLQYIWRVLKTPRQIIAVAANMLEPIGGVSHVRVVYPMQAMRSDPTVLTQLVTGSDIKVPGSDTPRIFVLHRPTLSGDRGAGVIRNLLADGWVVVTEFDDHPDHFGMLNADDELAFRGVHAVQTSTPALAAILRTRNPEVMVFPNMVRVLPDVRNFRDPQALTLFFGALNREHDWAPLMPALNDVAEKAGERLRFMSCTTRVSSMRFTRRTSGSRPSAITTPICALLGECEISLMPLEDTPFNRAKSDLKFIEAAACRVAALASHIVYGDSIEDGRTGLLFHDAGELHDRLLRLVAMPELARGLGDAARHYVAGERMLAYQMAPRIAWYRSLWARRAELSNALYARLLEVPLLADGAPMEMGTLP